VCRTAGAIIAAAGCFTLAATILGSGGQAEVPASQPPQAASSKTGDTGVSVERPSEWHAEDPGPRGCPRESWPGPWTACAEAGWVRRVVAAGGYQVLSETGSALVADGQGRSFYIWTTPAVRNAAAIAADAGNWGRLATIDANAIYGDNDLWRFWQAQGFTFWVKEGPTGASIVPSPAQLASLVQASRKIPPPRQ
jgi:hypothetical protein